MSFYFRSGVAASKGLSRKQTVNGFKQPLRSYASEVEAKPKSSNTSLLLLGGGIAGIGAYLYLYGPAAFTTAPKQVKSPLDKDNFVDFKLKKIIPYNHDTKTCVFALSLSKSFY